MKLRNIFTIIVLNVFLLGMVSLFQEYTSLRSTLQQLNTTIDLSVDRAISNTMSSEEMFSDKFNTLVSSEASSYKDSSKYLYATLKVMRGGKWVTGNMYIMSMFYQQKGRFPNSQNEYATYSNGITTETIYEWLFGDIASDYNSSSLSWAFSNQNGTGVFSNASRQPTQNFIAFYANVGEAATSYATLQQKAGSTWVTSTDEISTLLQMGLKLDPLNSVTSTKTTKNFVSVAKNGYSDSVYYLTPYSLGVTYIPYEVLKPSVLSNIEQMIRFNKSKSFTTSLTDTASISMQDYASADGCVPLALYDLGSNVPKEHKTPDDTGSYVTNGNLKVTDILNDGKVEYDMSTLQVKVDYFFVDFYDQNNWQVVNYIKGSIPYETDLTQLPGKLAATDTTSNPDLTGMHIVAKVSVRVKIHIPYQSSVMQWFVDATSEAADEHYDIKMWNPDSNSIVQNSDGLWYEYSTYVAISR